MDPDSGFDPMRQRLVDAGLRAMARHGYVGCTVAEIVAEARTSRRAFYAHFADREDCLLAGYELVTDALLARMDVVRSKQERWPERPLAGLDTYLRSVLDSPGLARVFFVEIHRCGPKADSRRMAVLRRWAEWQRHNSSVDLDLPGPEGVVRRALTLEESLAAMAGISEVMAHALGAATPPDREALRRQLAVILLSFSTSSVPADPWVTWQADGDPAPAPAVAATGDGPPPPADAPPAG